MNLQDLDVLFVRHVAKVEYVRRIRKMLCTDISSESNVVSFLSLLFALSAQLFLSDTGDGYLGSRLGLGSTTMVEWFPRRLAQYRVVCGIAR